MRLAVLAALAAFASVPGAGLAQVSPSPSPSPAPAQTVASVPAKEIAGIHAALEAEPLDCGAVDRAFTVLAHAGRRPGDVEAIVMARRTNAPCALKAADAAATTLAIPDSEVVAWVLRNPEAMPEVEPPSMEPAAEPELGQQLECGLMMVGRAIDRSESGTRVIMTFRNRSENEVRGYDIVARINGQPWRTTMLPKGELPTTPLGAAETLTWDTSTGTWEDRRQIETKSISWPKKDTPFKPMQGPVPPGGTFDVVARVEGITEQTQATDLEISFDSCVLR